MEVFVVSRGTRISVKNGMFEIRRDGEVRRISSDSVEAFYLRKGISLSSDFIFLALRNEIDIVFQEASGRPRGRCNPSRQSNTGALRKAQVAFASSSKAIGWITKLIIERIQSQQATIWLLARPDKKTDNEINKVVNHLEKIIKTLAEYHQSYDENSENYTNPKAKLRAWEANASKQYFACINMHLPDMYRFEKRSQHPANDLFNALLNYILGILYSKIEGAVFRAGMDASIGIFHADEYAQPVLTYDLIEPFRHWAEYTAIMLCHQQAVLPDQAEYTIDKGVLLSEDARKICSITFNQFMEGIVKIKSVERSRNTHLELYCQQTAQIFKKHYDEH